MAGPHAIWGLGPGSPRQEEILVTVKAYPNPSKKYIETVCVAGVTKRGQWIRLYPIPYRFLAYDQQFPTYGWITASVRKAKDDPRPESHRVDAQTIATRERIGTEDGWQQRREILEPLVSPSLEVLRDLNTARGTSLGLIRPKAIRRLVIQAESEHWSPEALAKLRQRTLIDAYQSDGTLQAVQELEKIPFRFKYEFVCDDQRCRGHSMTIISWEVMQSYRKWRQTYGDEWEAKFRQKYEEELPGARRDLHFYVGTVAKHPGTWTIIGLYYPPVAAKMKPSATQLALF